MKAAKLLQIDHLLDRLPKQLSGGQRQRVAIGRAIVRDPRVFLFDEPLSNLDAALRVATRLEIAKLHHSMGNVTMVYVTHDQVEAMTLADRICVLRDGLVMQVGSPTELYEKPNSIFVAGFIGSPKMNFLNGEIAQGYGCAHPRHPLRAHRRRQRQPDLEGRGGARREPRLGQLPLRRHRLRGAGAGAPGGQDHDPLGRAHRHPPDRGEPAPLRRQGRADAVSHGPAPACGGRRGQSAAASKPARFPPSAASLGGASRSPRRRPRASMIAKPFGCSVSVPSPAVLGPLRQRHRAAAGHADGVRLGRQVEDAEHGCRRG